MYKTKRKAVILWSVARSCSLACRQLGSNELIKILYSLGVLTLTVQMGPKL